VNKQSSFSDNELIDCANGHLFGEGNAQLPLPPMLMFDRITTITNNGGLFGKGEVLAELDISPDLWFFACHFNNDPVMPGCLGLDALWQAEILAESPLHPDRKRDPTSPREARGDV
jgi:3-hydroxyacyl-[acyl-carrier protein] dehydratase / trans-2-decenoyl-[acyl-carrier protein] isomerase